MWTNGKSGCRKGEVGRGNRHFRLPTEKDRIGRKKKGPKPPQTKRKSFSNSIKQFYTTALKLLENTPCSRPFQIKEGLLPLRRESPLPQTLSQTFVVGIFFWGQIFPTRYLLWKIKAVYHGIIALVPFVRHYFPKFSRQTIVSVEGGYGISGRFWANDESLFDRIDTTFFGAIGLNSFVSPQVAFELKGGYQKLAREGERWFLGMGFQFFLRGAK